MLLGAARGMAGANQCLKRPPLAAVWRVGGRGSERQGRGPLGGCNPGRKCIGLPGESGSTNSPQSGAHPDHQEVLQHALGPSGISRPFQRLTLPSKGLKPILR